MVRVSACVSFLLAATFLVVGCVLPDDDQQSISGAVGGPDDGTPELLPPLGAYPDIAFQRPTTQSSTVYGGDPRRAVDGNADGDWNHSSVTHTDLEAQPWWQVDLQSVAYVDNIRIANRTDCCADRLREFFVLVSDRPFTSTDLATTLEQPGVSSYYMPGIVDGAYDLPVGRTARYVRVQLQGFEHLSLAEVFVRGLPDQAQFRFAWQSSTLYGGEAARVVDGNTDGVWNDGSVSHTDYQTNPWLQIDLGRAIDIQSIELRNRTDCCVERLNHVHVMVFPEGGEGHWDSPVVENPGERTVLEVGERGRYISVELRTDTPEYLSLAEVLVHGLPSN